MSKPLHNPPEALAWQRLLEPEIAAFIRRHEHEDVAKLALQKPPMPGWPYPLILDQIKTRQKAADKFPAAMLSTSRIVLPRADLVEQASSQAAAAYKASLVSGRNFADLTTGAGIDSLALALQFETGFCVERDEYAASLLRHNFKELGINHIEIRHESAEQFMAGFSGALDLVYLDPQRRNEQKRGLYRLEDTAPNILELLPAFKDKARRVMLKASPMLDIDLGIKSLGCAENVHVLERGRECKELVFLLRPQDQPEPDQIPITVAVLDEQGKAAHSFTFTRAQEREAVCEIAQPLRYLYDPGPGFHKAGCFRFLAAHYGLKKLHPSTHLYTADRPCSDFPGRSFIIENITRPEASLMPARSANIAVRNFPASVAELRKKLKLQDGGDHYLFACTLADDRKAIIQTRKAG